MATKTVTSGVQKTKFWPLRELDFPLKENRPITNLPFRKKLADRRGPLPPFFKLAEKSEKRRRRRKAQPLAQPFK